MTTQGIFMMQSFVQRIDYDFTAREGTLFQDEGCCCNAGDCIEFFRRIDPKVRLIGDQVRRQR
jgi:hypothetical protein